MIKKNICFITVLAVFFSFSIFSQETDDTIYLPEPELSGSMPLMEALSKRQSQRSFAEKELSNQMLANLLWAAFGINRPESGKRTAPSAHNWQETEIYAVMEQGAYLYNAKKNMLTEVHDRDIRGKTGKQPFVKDAPLNLVYVADFSKMTDADDTQKPAYAHADVAFIGQNVYLFCASEGLATVIRAYIDKEALAEELNLPEHKRVILSQTVGFPKPGTE